MEEARELQSLRTAHRKLGGVETKLRKRTELKMSYCVLLTASSLSTVGDACCPATREAGSALGDVWNIGEQWGRKVAMLRS